MDRREAMMRELNLYPLWVRRDLPERDHVVPVAANSEVAALSEMPVQAVAVQPEKPVQPETPVQPEKLAQPEIVAHPEIASQPEVPLQPVAIEVEPTEPLLSPAQADVAASLVGVFHAQQDDAESGYETSSLFDDPGHFEPDADAQQDAADSLREFQLKVAAGPFAEVDWPELKQKVGDCALCELRSGCRQTVFGTGSEQADWLFVGEAPGEEEDARGEPFVGHAGRLLDNMLMAIQLKRGRNVYIANVIKCRPPEDRHPHVGEVAHCLPYLKRQIALVKPKVIVALGKTAAHALLGEDVKIATMRGTVHDYRGIPLVITYHPAYLLRSPMEKAKAWDDLRLAVATMRQQNKIVE